MHYCMGILIKAFSTVIVGSLNSVLICTIYKITLNLSPLSYYISTEISHLYRKFSKTLRVFESPPGLHPIRDHHRDKCMFSMCLSYRDKYIFLHCICLSTSFERLRFSCRGKWMLWRSVCHAEISTCCCHHGCPLMNPKGKNKNLETAGHHYWSVLICGCVCANSTQTWDKAVRNSGIS